MTPKSKNVWRSIALDPRSPIATRLEALKQFQPSRYTLRKLVQANQPARIRAAAAKLLEIAETIRELMRDEA